MVWPVEVSSTTPTTVLIISTYFHIYTAKQKILSATSFFQTEIHKYPWEIWQSKICFFFWIHLKYILYCTYNTKLHLGRDIQIFSKTLMRSQVKTRKWGGCFVCFSDKPGAYLRGNEGHFLPSLLQREITLSIMYYYFLWWYIFNDDK